MPMSHIQIKLVTSGQTTLDDLIAGRQVLEVGAGVNPLCCLAALKHCRRYVATDGSLQALEGLTGNFDLNSR